MRSAISIMAGWAALAGSALAAGQAPIPPELQALARGDYGCEVLLCLANPAGPMAAPACVPPMRRLMRELARGRGFPHCKMAAGPAGAARAVPVARAFDACPAGTRALAAGQYAELAGTAPAAPALPSGARSPYAPGAPGLTYAGIGEDATGSAGGDGPAPVKVCVAGWRGERAYSSGLDTWTVGVYEALYVQRPAVGALAIDVFIDERLWQTVRW